MDYSRFLTPITKNDRLSGTKFYTRILNNAANETPNSVSFCAGMPSDDTYPFTKLTLECADGSKLVVDKDELLKLQPYQTAQGLPQLVEWIRKIHKTYHQAHRMDADANDPMGFEVAITQGAAGALAYLFVTLVEKDDVVLVEDYGFGATRTKIRMRQADCVAMEVDNFGIIPEKLRDQLENLKKESRLPRIMVTNPNGQNPTGTVCPMKRKREIYKIAQDYNLLFIEDDPYHYLQFTKERTSSYQSIDVDGRVIRIDSVSKLIAPSLRIGWVTGPRAIVRQMMTVHIAFAMQCSSLSQIAVTKLFDNWQLDGFERRITDLSSKYESMRNTVVRSLDMWFKDLGEWKVPEAGIYIWVKLTKTNDSSFLGDVEKAKKWKIFVVPGLDYVCNKNETNPYFRLCFTRLPEDRIDEGIRRLAEFVRAHSC